MFSAGWLLSACSACSACLANAARGRRQRDQKRNVVWQRALLLGSQTAMNFIVGGRTLQQAGCTARAGMSRRYCQGSWLEWTDGGKWEMVEGQRGWRGQGGAARATRTFRAGAGVEGAGRGPRRGGRTAVRPAWIVKPGRGRRVPHAAARLRNNGQVEIAGGAASDLALARYDRRCGA